MPLSKKKNRMKRSSNEVGGGCKLAVHIGRRRNRGHPLKHGKPLSNIRDFGEGQSWASKKKKPRNTLLRGT